jgi:superfamily II RNA helicase
MKITNRLHVIQNAKGNFQEENYTQIKKTLELFENKNQYIKRSNVLNQVSKYMVDNNMLPAICFVFSRKSLEVCAKEITTNLLEFDSKVPYIIKNECEQIIRKLPNYKEYLYLPEYVQMVALLEKGIAIHHAGIMPILREMVELLFSKGYIKLLFATETFAVGINMPTKTVVFTDVNKYDGNSLRMLYPHEYTQMAGRAGRRGIDTVGNVIHLNNLYKNIKSETIAYKQMLKGAPQKLVSKFKISYHLLMNLISIGNQNFSQFAKQSMMQETIDKELQSVYSKLTNVSSEIENMEQSLMYLHTPRETVDEYIDLLNKRVIAVNSKRRDIDRKINQMIDCHKNIEKDKQSILKIKEKYKQHQELQDEMSSIETYVDKNVLSVLNMLEDYKYIDKCDTFDTFDKCDTFDKKNPIYQLTLKGTFAIQIREVHCILFTDLLIENKLNNFTSFDLVSFLSCFTNISVPEDRRTVIPYSQNENVQKLIIEVIDNHKKLEDKELTQKIELDNNFTIQFDLLQYMYEWCECDDVNKCKTLLQKMSIEKEIFLGEFVKAVLKINNIVNELEKVAENLGNIQLLHTLKEIPQITLKYVATNQSLYI